MNSNFKNISLKSKIIIVYIIVVLLVVFFVIKPIVDFKIMEKQFLESGHKYFEINSNVLPTGNKIKTVGMKQLYEKDYLNEDFKTKINNKKCSVENSFIRVKKNGSLYEYYQYLECGLLKSKIDHVGPEIKLNGKDEINIYLGKKYKELGVSSVIDNVDGNISINKVKIDNSTVNTNKTGTYKVIYSIKDSFDNETKKERIVNVIETLNHIVKTQTNKENIYNGYYYNNYLKLDGIIFKIVGINKDGSVKVVSSEPLAAVNYDKVDTWLNDYFYSKLSSSVKKYIKQDSTWCSENVKDAANYVDCKKYDKKSPVGLLSIDDYNNSIKNSESNIITSTLLYNLKDKNNVYKIINNTISTDDVNSNILISPSLNIIKNAKISSGNGSTTSPYVLSGTNKTTKVGEKISNAKIGEYIVYSGYKFRIIGKEDDETTKIIMNDVIRNSDKNVYYIRYSDNSNMKLTINSSGNILYNLLNNTSKYLKTNLLVSKTEDYGRYSGKITYQGKKTGNKNKLKVNLPSMYDLFSATIFEDYWYKEYNKDNYCYMYYQGRVECRNYNYSDIKGIRPVVFLNKNVTIKKGTGLEQNPYEIAK